MNHAKEFFKEILLSISPVVLNVLLLAIFVIDVSGSGPMAVTFILAFSQGAASYYTQADALDAFGVIALIAMTPVVMVEILGTIYKLRQKNS